MNDAYLRMPFADILYFADYKWWEWHNGREEYKAFQGEKCTIFCTGNLIGEPEVHMVRNHGSDGMSSDPSGVHTSANSGHQLTNVVALAGAARIILVGFDARLVAGRAHFFGDHIDKTTPPFWNVVHGFETAKQYFIDKGIEVLNATPGSAIKTFPIVSIQEALSCVK